MVVTKDELKAVIKRLQLIFNYVDIPIPVADVVLEELQYERVTGTEARLAIGMICKEETAFYKHSNLLAMILKRLPAVRGRIKSERARFETKAIDQPPDYEKLGHMAKVSKQLVNAPKIAGESDDDRYDRIGRETDQALEDYDRKQLNN